MSGSVELIEETRKFRVTMDGETYYLKMIQSYEDEITWCEYYDKDENPIEDNHLRERLLRMVLNAFKDST